MITLPSLPPFIGKQAEERRRAAEVWKAEQRFENERGVLHLLSMMYAMSDAELRAALERAEVSVPLEFSGRLSRLAALVQAQFPEWAA